MICKVCGTEMRVQKLLEKNEKIIQIFVCPNKSCANSKSLKLKS